jgi:hypothetical protein
MSITSASWTDDEAKFLVRIKQHCPDAVEPAQEIFDWARREGITVKVGRGSDHATLELQAGTADRGIARLRERPPGAHLELLFGRAEDPTALADEQIRRDLQGRFGDQKLTEFAPWVPLPRLADAGSMAVILTLLGCLARRARG